MEAARNVIVYFGMGFLPDRNAIACRQQTIGYAIKEVGYEPVLIGINENTPFGGFEQEIYDGVECYAIRYARSAPEKIKDIFVIEKMLISILEKIGIQRIKCFIMQDYQLRPMNRMARFCKRHGIAFCADIMDWFTPSRDYSLAKNIGKTVDTYLRMHLFYPGLKNKICISHRFEAHFSKSKNNCVVFPCTSRDIPDYKEDITACNRNVTMTFAGFLGKKCEKEKLDWLIQALYENLSTIELNIVGITREMFESRVPELADRITEHVHFYGKLPRYKCVELLRQSDFAVVVRKRSKLTDYGFSSKICEAFAHGIPVIATNNSDNALYIQNGVNGFICDADYPSVKALLRKIEKLSPEKRLEMRENLRERNPLNVRLYLDRLSAFIHDLDI